MADVKLPDVEFANTAHAGPEKAFGNVGYSVLVLVAPMVERVTEPFIILKGVVVDVPDEKASDVIAKSSNELAPVTDNVVHVAP